MKVLIVNPSDTAFGTAVITPGWMFGLARATPAEFGHPVLIDETLEQLEPEAIQRGAIVGIGIHTGNTLRGYEVGRIARGAPCCCHLRRNPRFSISRRSAGTRLGAFRRHG